MGFTLFISDEYMNDIIKIMKSLEDSCVVIDGITVIVKHEIKKKRRRISWSFVNTRSHFISAISDFVSIKSISGRGFRRAGRGYMNKIF